MKIYLDTANWIEWKLPSGCPPIQGVTTNPTLVKQAGLPVILNAYLDLISRAADLELTELMMQLPSSELSDVRQWLDELLTAAKRANVVLTIKLPCHPSWSAVIAEVRERGQPFLLTGVSNPVQLLWAKSQGAHFVAPYLGRLQEAGRDIDAFVGACVAAQIAGPKLLAASIRNTDVFSRLVASGAYAATVRPAFLKGLITDPLTDSAIKDFEADIAASQDYASPSSER